jgi:hypothetical protein
MRGVGLALHATDGEKLWVQQQIVHLLHYTSTMQLRLSILIFPPLGN